MRIPIFLFLAACGNQAEICDDMAYWSVSLTVVDAADNAVPTATVTYTVDGEDRGACEQLEGAAFACGIEEAGDFVVTVAAEGFVTESASLTVPQGACHVGGQAVSVVLAADESECDDVAHAAIRVGLSTQSGADLVNPQVEYRPTDADAAARVECDVNGEWWFCAWDDLSGSFEVYAWADGFAELTEAVTVPTTADGCHPETQTVELVFADGG